MKIIVWLLCLLVIVSGVCAADVEVFWDESIGVVSSTFYGVNNHGTWGSGNAWIDANGDGVYEARSDDAWNRQMMLDAGITYLRADMHLDGGLSTYPHFSGRVTVSKGMVKWAYEHNVTMLYIASYMPYWLANITPACSAVPSRCGPKDYQVFADLVVEWIDEVTLNGTYAGAMEIELWNEPDLSMFSLPNGTMQERIAVYNAMYGPMYDAIKRKYPGMAVGGLGLANPVGPGREMLKQWMIAYPQKQDFVSFHRYFDGNVEQDLGRVFDNVSGLCVETGAKCSRFLLDEFNTWNSGVKVNDSGEYARRLGLAYVFLLNRDASMSTAEYQWSEAKPYRAGIGYPEYPQRWSMVSEPLLDGEVYVSYNVTSDVARNHPPGAAVYRSVGNVSHAVVASAFGGERSVTLVNRVTGVMVNVRSVVPVVVVENVSVVEGVSASEGPGLPEEVVVVEKKKDVGVGGSAPMTYKSYVSKYDKGDLPVIVIDGIGTGAAEFVGMLEIVIVGLVLLMIVGLVKMMKRGG